MSDIYLIETLGLVWYLSRYWMDMPYASHKERDDTAVIPCSPPPVTLPPARLQPRSSPNHRVCRYFLPRITLLARFRVAACALGISNPISNQPNLHRRWPWSAPQVLQPPKTGRPWMITTWCQCRLQHRVKTRPHSAPASRNLSDAESFDCWGDPIQPMKIFLNGCLRFHNFASRITAPYLSATSTPAFTRAIIASFSSATLCRTWPGLGAWTTSCVSTASSQNEFCRCCPFCCGGRRLLLLLRTGRAFTWCWCCCSGSGGNRFCCFCLCCGRRCCCCCCCCRRSCTISLLLLLLLLLRRRSCCCGGIKTQPHE